MNHMDERELEEEALKKEYGIKGYSDDKDSTKEKQ